MIWIENLGLNLYNISVRRILFIYFFIYSFTVLPQSVSAGKILTEMLDSIRHLNTVRFKVKALERVENGYSSAVSESKIQIKPRQLYFVNKEKKLEILYVSGKYENKAVVKPHVFPYVTMQLNPSGNIMRKNQHYTIHELGFDFIGRTIALALSKEKENMLKCLSYLGKHEKNGYNCHMVVYESSAFSFFTYTVGHKETVTTIAAKFNVNDYLLRVKNDLFNDFGFIKEGTKLQIPNYYCKRAILYIDEKTMLPMSVSIYDDMGLFECYDFYNVISNKPIDPSEFTKEFKDYHF